MGHMVQLEVGSDSNGKGAGHHQVGREHGENSSEPHRRRGFKTKGKRSLFAAVLPLEAKKLLFRMNAKEQWVVRRWERRKLMLMAAR